MAKSEKKDKLLAERLGDLSRKKDANVSSVEAGDAGVIGHTKSLSEIFDNREEFSYIPLNMIVTEEQVRKRINTKSDTFRSLVASIKEKGVLEPVLVMDQDGKFLLLAGERRFLACQELKLPHIPARIMTDQYDKNDILEIQLIENLQREDLNPLDEAEAFHRYLKNRSTKKDIDGHISDLITYYRNPEKLSEETKEAIVDLEKISGISAKTIQNLLTLLKLPMEAKEAVRENKIGQSNAYILAKHAESPKIDETVQRALKENPTKRTLLKWLSEGEKKGKERSYSVKLRTYRKQIEKNIVKITKTEIAKILQEIEELKRTIEGRAEKDIKNK